MKLFIEVVNHLASKYYENGGWTSITRFPASWLNLQVLGKMCIFIELDDGKIYRKPLYLMVKTMVSCRFSLKPIHWYIQNIPKYQPMGSTWSTWYRLSGHIRKHRVKPYLCGNIPFFFLLLELQLGHLNQSSMSMLSLDFHVEFGLPWISWWGLRTEHLGEEWHRPVIGISGQSNVWVILGRWDLQNRPFFLLKNSPKCLFATICKWCKTWVPCSFHDGNLSPKGSYGKDLQGFGLIGTSTYILIGNASDICDMVKTYGFWCFCVFAQKRIVISPIQKGFHRPMNLGIPFMMLGRPCSIWVPSNLTMAHDIWVRLKTSNWPIKINMGKFSIYTLW